jgi:hypothetical protein
MAKQRAGRTIEVMAGGARRPAAPKKPSDSVYVQLPEDQPAELFEFREDGDNQYVDAALQGVMLELGERDDSAKVTVKRIVEAQGQRRKVWLFECHPREFSIPQLQMDFGEGEYQITVYGAQEGSNYKIIHADKRLSIGAARGAGKTDQPASAPAVRDADQFTRAISVAIAGPLSTLAQALTQMMPKQTSRADMIAELKQFAEMFTAMRPPVDVTPRADPFDSLERAVALLRDAKGAAPIVNEDGEIPPTQILSQGIELLKGFFAAASQRQGAQAALPAPGTQPAPAPQLAPPGADIPAAQPAQPQGIDMGLFLKMQLGIFLNAARNDSDPITYGAILYEQAPDEILAKLESAEWFAELCKLEPGFSAHREWCEKVRAEVIAALHETPEGEEATASAEAPTPPVAH